MVTYRTIKSPAFADDTPEDQAKAHDVFLAVTQMGMQLYTFESCVSLFEFLTERVQTAKSDDPELMKFAYWRFIPAQQGALCIWHFRKSLEALKVAVNRQVSISTAIDSRKLKEAIEIKFRAKFPDWERLRFGVAHNAEAHYSSVAGVKHSVTGTNVLGMQLHEGGSLQATGIIGGKLVMTIDGKEVSYAVNRDSVDALRLISDQAIDALERN